MEHLHESPKASIPRLFARYHVANASIDLTIGHEGRFNRRRPVIVPAEIIDLSVGGALVRLPDGVELENGKRLTFAVEGLEGACAVRHLRRDPHDVGSLAGLKFVSMSDDLEAVLYRAISAVRGREASDHYWLTTR